MSGPMRRRGEGNSVRRNEVKNSRSLHFEQAFSERLFFQRPWHVSPVVAPRRVYMALGLAAGLLIACSSSPASTAAGERVVAKSGALTPAVEAGNSKLVPRIEPVVAPAPAGTAEAARSTSAASAEAAKPTRGAERARPAGITARHLEAELNRLEDELER